NIAGTGTNPQITLITNDTYTGTDGLTHETMEEFILGYVNGHTNSGQLVKFDAAGNARVFLFLSNFHQIVAVAGHEDLGLIEGTPSLMNAFVGNGLIGAYMNTGSGASLAHFEVD